MRRRRTWTALAGSAAFLLASTAFAQPGALTSHHPSQRLNDALLDAAASGDAGTARALLERGANPNSIRADFGEQTALMLAAHSGDFQTVEALVERGADMDKTGNLPQNDRTTLEDVSPLAVAVMSGNRPIIRYLASRGAEPEPPVLVRRLTPMGAVEREAQPLLTLARDPATAEMLVKAGANPNERAGDGDTALARAYARKDTVMIDTLRALGADEDEIRGVTRPKTYRYSRVSPLRRNHR